MPLLNPIFEQPEEGREDFSCREKTGLWKVDRARVDKDGVEVIE